MATNRVTIAESYQPHAKQAAAHRSGARFLAMAAGVRGGKTKGATVEFLRRIYLDVQKGRGRPVAGFGRRKTPALRYWVVGPTQALTTFPHEYILQFAPSVLVENVLQNEYAIWMRPNIQIQFKTGERPDLLVGADVDGMLLTEACRIKAEAWRGALRGRLASTRGWGIFESSPLGGRNSWVYQEIVSKAAVVDGVPREGGDPDFASFSWKTSDNPHIDPSEIESARRQLPDAWFKRDFEASWDSFGGAIYEDWRDEVHVVSEEQFRFKYGVGRDRPLRTMFRRVVAGKDFGFTSPGALIVVAEIAPNQYLVVDESYAPNRPILEGSTSWLTECRRLKEKWNLSVIAADPARPDGIFDLRNNRVDVKGAHNDIQLGLRRVAEALHVDPATGRPGLYVLAGAAPNLVREIRNYKWKSNREQTGFLESPEDGQSDHALDALRYALVELNPFSYTDDFRKRQSGGRLVY